MRIASIVSILAIGALASPAMAVDEVVKYKIQGGIATGKASTRDQIKDDIALYFGKQKTPAVVKKIWEGDSTQTSGRRSPQERCETAFASAIVEGGGRRMSTAVRAHEAGTAGLGTRIDAYDWSSLSTHLDAHGWAIFEKLLTADECETIAGLYDDDGRFRSHVVMARHGFGRGEYKYFTYPLPDIVADLRRAIYPNLAPIANRWNASMGIDVRYPDAHADFIARCHKAGQTRPTPLLLQYAAGDYNALHQDLYGEHVFPLQLTILLSEPEKDFTGGEFVLTEQRPRMQSRAEVVPLRRGDAVVFAVHHRPVQGTRGTYRVNLRHGVSRLRSGHRHTVGVIFHDAK